MALASWLPRLQVRLGGAQGQSRRYIDTGGLVWTGQGGLTVALTLTFPWDAAGQAAGLEQDQMRRERLEAARHLAWQLVGLRRSRARLCAGPPDPAARAEVAVLDELLALILLTGDKCGLVLRFAAPEGSALGAAAASDGLSNGPRSDGGEAHEQGKDHQEGENKRGRNPGHRTQGGSG